MEKIFYIIDAIDKTGSITRTSQLLHLTVPAVSIAIKKEEHLVGQPLLDRLSKPLKLTDTGRLYLQYFKKAKLLDDDLQKELNDLQNGLVGTLRLGGTQYINSFFLPGPLSSFISSYPKVKIDLKEGSADSIREDLHNGIIDLCISSAEFSQSEYEALPAFADEIVLAVPKSFPVTADYKKQSFSSDDLKDRNFDITVLKSVDLKKFENIPFILLSAQNDLYRRTVGFLDRKKIDCKPILQPDQMVTACHLADAGIGATFISDRLVKQVLPKNLLFFRLGFAECFRQFWVLTDKKRYQSVITRKFIELLCRGASSQEGVSL